jgi:predicted transcriptional regulator
VVRDGEFVGCVDLDAVKRIARGRWEEKTVGDLTADCGDRRVIAADASLTEAFRRFQRTRADQLIVVENGRLAGLVHRSDLESFLAVRLHLDE